MQMRARWSTIRSLLRGGKERNRPLQDAFNEHGEEAFSFEYLEQVSLPEFDQAHEKLVQLLVKAEQRWVDKLKPEFNAGLGTQKGRVPYNKGKSATPEAKAKMRAAHFKRKQTPGAYDRKKKKA